MASAAAGNGWTPDTLGRISLFTHTHWPSEDLVSPAIEMDLPPADHTGLIHISIDLDELNVMKSASEIRIKRKKIYEITTLELS